MIEWSNITGDKAAMDKIGGVRAKSLASTVFYPKWKLDAITHPKIIDFFDRLMKATFGPSNRPGYEHPFGSSEDLLLFLDGATYRLPDHLQAEGGLSLHLDRNPFDPFLLRECVQKKLTKFRPVQCWLGLTDHYGGMAGGLRVVRGFHKEHDAYFGKSPLVLDSTGGEFYRLNPNSHAKLWSRAEPVDVPAGSMVLWDNRLPHSTSDQLVSDDTREVLYFSYLPACPINLEYTRQQQWQLLHLLAPPQFVDRRPEGQLVRDWDFNDLTPLQHHVMRLEKKDWKEKKLL